MPRKQALDIKQIPKGKEGRTRSMGNLQKTKTKTKTNKQTQANKTQFLDEAWQCYIEKKIMFFKLIN